MARYSQRTPVGQRAARASSLAAQAIAAILLLLSTSAVNAQLGTAAGTGKPQFFDDSGNACASCTLTSSVTATATPLDTYTTAALSVANSNPQTLDAAGRPVTGLFLTPGLTYRLVLKTAAGATIWSYDGIAGANGVSADRLRLSTHSATIATGTFTATYSQYTVDTEGAAASDDLDTITAGTGVGAGSLLVLTPANVSHVVTAKDSTGNLKLGGGDYALDSAKKSLTLYYDGSNWVEVARAGSTTVDVGTCNGRLTLESGVAVSTTDQTAKTNVYYTPYHGNRCALYDGSVWAVSTFTEKTLALGTLTSGLPYDVFLYNNSGTLTLEALAWTNGTTRATALTLQDGVLVKTGATTRRYRGTFYTTATTTTEDSLAKRLLWNVDNRVRRPLLRQDPTASWSYSTAAYQQANAAAANQIAVVVGVAESAISLRVHGLFSTATANAYGGVNLGEDSTTTKSASAIGSFMQEVSTNNELVPTTATLEKVPAVGYHFYAWLEYASGATTTWYGFNAAAAYEVNGLTGSIDN